MLETLLTSSVVMLVGGIPTPLQSMKVRWDCTAQLNGNLKDILSKQPLIECSNEHFLEMTWDTHSIPDHPFTTQIT